MRATRGVAHPPLGFLPAGWMEGGSSAETRRVPRPPKQHGQSGGRTPALPEHPEAARGPHAILESKVKALKEKRGGGRPGTPTAAPERVSPKKPRPRRGKPGSDAAASEPRAQLRTYLTDGLLDGGEPVAGGPQAPAPRAGTPGLWRVPAPKGDVPGGTELPRDEGSGSHASASPHERPPLEEEARTPPQDEGGPSVSPTAAEGWERLSLAERVERNRRLLQEVLGLAAPGAYFGQVAAVSVEPGGVGRKSFGGGKGVLGAIVQLPAALRCFTPQGCPIPCRFCIPYAGSCRRCPQTKWGPSFFTGMLWALPVPSGILVRNFTAKSKKPAFWGTRGLQPSSSLCKLLPEKGINLSFESVCPNNPAVPIPAVPPHAACCCPTSHSSGASPEHEWLG